MLSQLTNCQSLDKPGILWPNHYCPRQGRIGCSGQGNSFVLNVVPSWCRRRSPWPLRSCPKTHSRAVLGGNASNHRQTGYLTAFREAIRPLPSWSRRFSLSKTATAKTYFGQECGPIELSNTDSTMLEPINTHPNLKERLIGLALDGLPSPHTRRAYRAALDELLTWSQGQQPSTLSKTLVNRYKAMLIDKKLVPATINQRLAAVRRLAQEMADNGLLETGGRLRNLQGAWPSAVRCPHRHLADFGWCPGTSRHSRFGLGQGQAGPRHPISPSRLWHST
jgi:hypothetical protein